VLVGQVQGLQLVRLWNAEAHRFHQSQINRGLKHQAVLKRGAPQHIYKHGVSEAEVEQLLSHADEDRPGRDGSRVAVGRTLSGRLLRVIYVPDPQPDSHFVITAHELRVRLRRHIGADGAGNDDNRPNFLQVGTRNASAAFSSTTNRRPTKKRLRKTRRRFRSRRLWTSRPIWCRPSAS